MILYKKAATVFSVCILLAAVVFAQTTQKPATTYTLKESMTNGKLVYKRVCLSCHQADGGGVPNMTPPLIKTTYVLGDKKKLILIVLNGLNGSIEINDDTYSGVMASHSYLKDREIADVLTYVRKSFTNNASRIAAADVQKVRAANKK